MSYHVYLSREGFKQNPIGEGEWLTAARQCEELVVDEQPGRLGNPQHFVHLRGNARQWLHRNPLGIIESQDPAQEMVAVMFRLADLLDAGVYSERLKRYQTVADWEKRTKAYRQSRDARRQLHRAAQRKRWIFWAAVLIGSFAIGWLVDV